jgi:hypothetical protein
MTRVSIAFAYLGVLILYVVSAMAQSSSTVSADQTWNELTAGNRRFVLGKTKQYDFPAQRRP